MTKVLLTILIVLTSIAITADQINIKAKDGFNLAADYLAPEAQSKKAVLMLHQCNADKSMYADLARELAKEGIHSLALDFRGFGKSVDDIYSQEKIRGSATSREDYFKKFRKMQKDHWQSDVLAAYQYLAGRVDSNNISFIGASCGGGQSIHLAKKVKPKSFTFFSSGMNDETITDFLALSDIPALIIAAVDDEYTFKSSNTIFIKAKNDNSRLLSYKGAGHGLPLFKQDTNLQNVMVQWFKKHSQ